MALSNANITLRALEPDDVELLYKWENDRDVWRVSNTRTPLSKFALANYIKSADKDIWELKEMRLVIEDENHKPLGSLELFEFDPYHGRAGVGVLVFEQSERRKGIALTALEMLFDYAKNELGLTQVYANIAESNLPSIALFKKLGFVEVGLKKNWLRTPEGFEGEWLMQKVL